MQKFTYAGYTVRYEQLLDDVVPIGLGMQADGILALVCRPPEDAEVDLLLLREVQVCWDCQILQRHDEPDKACLLCGGALDWAEVQQGCMGV